MVSRTASNPTASCHSHRKLFWSNQSMNATRFLLAAMVLGTAIAGNQASAQCSGNAGSCFTTNTASATVNALVKLGMGGVATTLTSPTADQIEIGASIP